jgi:protein-ribulosamine 3-kinase
MIPKEVANWLGENKFGRVVSERPVGGGCISNGMVLKTDLNRSVFLKINSSPPVDMFAREVEGLKAIKKANTPSVPDVYLHGIKFLLIEDMAPAPRQDDYWEVFGRQVAALHNYSSKQFGFQHDNYIGKTKQPNAWVDDGNVFFAEARLLYMAGLARELGLLNSDGYEKIVDLSERLPQLIPEQSPSLLHGDLWSGNAMTDSKGYPAIIDPAVHYGWGEAELAMTTLFGTFPGVFFKSYEEIRPLESGYQSRFPIYNLYHLLNHVVLFGQGYLGQVNSILRRFCQR